MENEKRFKITKSTIQTMIDLYKKGMSSKKIAKQFNCSTNTVIKYLKKEGIEIRGPQKISDDQMKNIIKLYQEDLWSCRMIAEKFDLNDVTIMRALKKNNIKLRDVLEWHSFKKKSTHVIK